MPGLAFSGGGGYAPQRIGAPAGFGWNFGAHPVRVFKDGPRHFATDIDLRSKVSSDIWNGPVYYVSPTGSNNNSGTTAGAALRSLWKARQLLQASAAPGGIIMAMADPATGIAYWDRAHDFNDTAGAGGAANAQPTKPFALMSFGGRSFMGPFVAGLAWSFDAATRTFVAARGGVASLIDVSLAGDLGVTKRMRRIAAGTGADAAARLAATQALVGAQTGVYAQSDNSLVLRMDRDVAPSDATLRVVLQFADALLLGTVDAYVSGFHLIGAHNVGAVGATQVANRNLVFEDGSAGFSGVDAGPSRNGIVIDGTTGFVGFRRFAGLNSSNDDFNFHANNAKLHALMIDCEASGAGMDGTSPATQSNQNVTLHEDVRLISLNTRGRLASGGAVRNINASEHWDLGSEYAEDRGDVRFGGTQLSSAVVVNDTARYWGDCITARGCLQSFYATANAEIRLREPLEMGGQRGGSGLISPY